MMHWGNGMGGWGMVLMTVSTLLFWGLVIAGVAALVRYTRSNAPHSGAAPEAATPQRILAERFARGEIDEEEYTRRLEVLSSARRRGSPPARGGRPDDRADAAPPGRLR